MKIIFAILLLIFCLAWFEELSTEPRSRFGQIMFLVGIVLFGLDLYLWFSI